MTNAQTQKAKEDCLVARPSNPSTPEGDICFINNLPSELLLYVFALGSTVDDEEDDGDVSDGYWDNVRHRFEESVRDVGDFETAEETAEELDEEGYEEVTRSSDFLSPWLPFPVLVSHVCRRWRNLVLLTPTFWRTIEVYLVARGSYNFESMLLNRGKNLPIDIYVDCDLDEYHYSEAPSDPDFKVAVSTLTPHIHRWRTMQLMLSEYHHMHIFLSAVSDPSISAAPQLGTLKLWHHNAVNVFNFEFPSLSDHFPLFGGSAPLLTSIVLWGVHVDWSQPWIASASNLKELQLGYHAQDVRPSWAQFAAILCGASSLEQLILHASGPSGDPAEWFVEPTPGSPADLNGPIQLPRLTEFYLMFDTQARANGLLRKLYLPALKSLVIGFMPRDDYTQFTQFLHELAVPTTSLSPAQKEPRGLLSRLESLHINNISWPIECVETLYAELQNLTSLTLWLQGLHRRFLDILGTPCTLIGRGNVWLPRLESLYVHETSGDILRKLVQKRKEVGAPLPSLYVKRYSKVFEEDAEWLKKNVKTFKFF